jgi:hypothetical protein
LLDGLDGNVGAAVDFLMAHNIGTHE